MNLLLILLLISQGIAGHGSSLYFDGTNNYVYFPSTQLKIQGDCSFMFWMKIDSIQSNAYIISYDSAGESSEANLQYGFNLRKTTFFIGHEYGYGQNQILEYGYTFDSDKWYFICVTRDTSIKKYNVYIDNSLITNYIYTYQPAGGENAKLRIGINISLGQEFVGNIDEVKIYNRTLDSIEVMWNYHHPGQIYSTDSLVAWYKFNEFSGDTLHDYSGRDNHGVIHGATWTIDSPVISGKQK